MERIDIRTLSLHIGEDAPIPCAVPCSLHGVLTAGEHVAHPFVGLGLLRVNELARSGCTFRTTLTVKREWQGATLLLRLEDIRGVCRVLLNGAPIGEIHHPYRILSVDITSAVHLGDNELCLVFDAPCVYALGEREGAPTVQDMAIGHISLELRRTPSIVSVEAHPRLTETGAVLHVKAHLFGADRTAKVVATLTSASGKMYYAGLSGGEGDVYVADPILWRVGTEDSPLYRLSVSLYREETLTDETSLTVGLTDIRVEGEPSHGRRELTFFVGGERTFIKSCTYRAPSLYPSADDAKQQTRDVKWLAEAGYNMIRIPSTEPFPSEHLLSLLDRYGILLWKMLPAVPSDPEACSAFLRDMRAHLSRCATHPCLALVSAPPEEQNRTLADAVREVSETLFFMTCTETERPNDTSVLWDTTAFSEGVQIESFSVCNPPPFLPTPAAVSRFAEEDRNLYGKTVEFHALGTSVPSLLLHAAERYAYPHGAEEAAYVTARYSMDIATEAIARARMSTPSSDGIHVGTWRDLYPSVSNALIDAYGGRGLAYYGIKGALAPTRLIVSRTDYRVRFLVHNDRATPYVGRLCYKVADRFNQQIAEGVYELAVGAHTLEGITSTDVSTLVFGRETEYYLQAWLDDGCAITSPTVCLFTKPKYFAYAPQAISTEIRGTAPRFEILLRSAAFVHGAYVTFGDLPATAIDNLVDLTSDMPVKLVVETEGMCTAERLAASLSVISVNRIGRA